MPVLLEALALTVIVPVTVAPLVGEEIETAGGALLTVTLTPALVAEFPLVSLATAVSVWLPLATEDVVQEKLYGEAVSAAPTFAPSTCICTLAIPALAEAVAFTVIVPLTVALLAGEVIETVGGVAVVLLTVTVTTALVAAFPDVSTATAESV